MDAILNWIWQGCLVAVMAAGLLRVLESSRARVRYLVLWLVLLLILLLPIVPASLAAIVPPPDSGLTTTPPEAVVTIPIAWWTSNRIVIVLWAAWVAVFAWRIVLATTALARAKRECRPLGAEIEARLPRWTAIRGTGRPARLMRSDRVASAAVLLGGRPAIAVAPRLLDQLTDEELDRIVVHEWAHVQRRDDVAHLVQLIVRACVGWHPAVWWCGRRLHTEREVACDEMAIALTGSPRAYAACLAKLATLPSASKPPLAAVAAISGSGVRRRVVRALAFERAAMGRLRIGTAIVFSVVVGVTAFTAGGFRMIAAVAEAAVPAAVIRFAGQPPSVGEPAVSETPLEDRRASTPSTRRAARVSGGSEVRPPRLARQSTVSVEAASATPEPVSNERAPVARSTDHESLVARPLAAPLFADLPHVPNTASTGEHLAASASTAAAAAPWDAAVDASVSVSRGSKRAAVATAGFFNRLGRRIGSSF